MTYTLRMAAKAHETIPAPKLRTILSKAWKAVEKVDLASIAATGLCLSDFAVLEGEADFEKALSKLGLPMIVKPSSQGSSVGMTKVEREEELQAAFAEARRFDPCVLAEVWIVGAEYTAAVLNEPGRDLRISRISSFAIQGLSRSISTWSGWFQHWTFHQHL